MTQKVPKDARSCRCFPHTFLSKELLGPPEKFTTLVYWTCPEDTPVKRPQQVETEQEWGVH